MSRARMVAVAGAIAAVGGLGAATVGVLGPLPAASAGGAGVTITVDTFDDEWTEDGDCSLREALFSANRDSAFDECAAGDGACSGSGGRHRKAASSRLLKEVAARRKSSSV